MLGRDGESETGANIHRKRPREAPPQWRSQASQELLRLRFRELRGLFDDAETLADVHEAWGVVASRLNARDGLLDEQVDAVKCSDQLTRLRQQWQDSSTTQLHLMMAECFSTSVATQPQQQEQRQEPVRSHFNRAMEQAMAQEAEAGASPKRQKTTETTTSVAPKTAVGVSTPPRLESAPPPPHDEIVVSPEPASLSPEPVPQDEAQVPVEDEAIPRQDEIMRALERRSQQMERLARSHQTLAEATQRLMEAIVNRQP
ncbi:hypothetical protein PR001_g9997 [Phytophthora rubi]|uniref:Uncharacterized protein n=1 Tax=Phytophthora rubi TaxID=129364 RepID=A0A6A3MAA3_9STRA|nr:hypothetical protein PR002_g10248 [Phytophthora rubi]KAE9033830.1 hypothetical protein PR001_g9997 [Phytophthora rubi]